MVFRKEIPIGQARRRGSFRERKEIAEIKNKKRAREIALIPEPSLGMPRGLRVILPLLPMIPNMHYEF